MLDLATVEVEVEAVDHVEGSQGWVVLEVLAALGGVFANRSLELTDVSRDWVVPENVDVSRNQGKDV